VTPGPQNGRHFSVPEGGLTTLVDFDGGPEGGVPVPQVINGATETIDSVAGFAINGGGEKRATAKKAQPKAPAKAAKATSRKRAKDATPQAKAEKAAKPSTGTASEAAPVSQPDDASEGEAGFRKSTEMLKKPATQTLMTSNSSRVLGQGAGSNAARARFLPFRSDRRWSDEEVPGSTPPEVQGPHRARGLDSKQAKAACQGRGPNQGVRHEAERRIERQRIASSPTSTAFHDWGLEGAMARGHWDGTKGSWTRAATGSSTR
jgi:hypothetical protein